MSFDDFIAELEAEARAEGPEAVAELEALRRAFALERRLRTSMREALRTIRLVR